MKKLLMMLSLTVALASTGLAQGTITWNNGNTSKISTNAVEGGPATGLTFANAGTAATTYYYALFYSTTPTVAGSSTAVVGNAGTYAFQDANWTFLNPSAISGYVTGPAYGTNSGTAGRYMPENTDAGHSGATVTANTTAEYWVVVGWSGNIGSTLTALENWYGIGDALTTGWIGESAVSALIAPGDPTTTPIPGTPASVFPGAFTLGIIPVPEPATLALAGLGGLSLLIFRRQRK